MDKPYDFSQLMAIINQRIKQVTGISVIEANSVGPEPAYPFFTWSFVTSHTDIGITDNLDEEVFESSIMFEAHSQKTTEATNLANWVRKLVQTDSFDQLGSANNFYVIDTGDVTDTNNIISVQVERRAGVQVNLRIKDSFHDDVPEMTSVQINSSDNTEEG